MNDLDDDENWSAAELEEFLDGIYCTQQQEQQSGQMVFRAAQLGMELSEIPALPPQEAVETLLREHFPWFNWSKDPLLMSFEVGS